MRRWRCAINGEILTEHLTVFGAVLRAMIAMASSWHQKCPDRVVGNDVLRDHRVGNVTVS